MWPLLGWLIDPFKDCKRDLQLFVESPWPRVLFSSPQLMVNCWFGAPWNPPKRKGLGLLRCTPIRGPQTNKPNKPNHSLNHRGAPRICAFFHDKDDSIRHFAAETLGANGNEAEFGGIPEVKSGTKIHPKHVTGWRDFRMNSPVDSG